jgi:hypothetical protein
MAVDVSIGLELSDPSPGAHREKPKAGKIDPAGWVGLARPECLRKNPSPHSGFGGLSPCSRRVAGRGF